MSRFSGLLGAVSLGALLAGCPAHQEPTVRAYRLTVVAPDRGSLESMLKTDEGRALLLPFSGPAEGTCPPGMWVPKISFALLASSAPGAGLRAEPAGLFDLDALIQTSQNKVQSLFGQKPSAADLNEVAGKTLDRMTLPEARAATANAAGRDVLKEASALIGSNSSAAVVFHPQRGTPADAQKADVKPARAAASAAIPKGPQPYQDIAALQKQIHSLFCTLPDNSSTLPMAVVLIDGTLPAVELTDTSNQNVNASRTTSPLPQQPVPPSTELSLAQRAFDRGLEQARAGNFELAIQELSFAIEKYPGYAAAFSNRGVAYMQTNRMGRAEDDLRRAIQLDPKDPHSHYNLAIFYGKKGEIDRGLDALDLALKLGYGKGRGDLIKHLKFKGEGDLELEPLRKKRDEYCAVLERNGFFLCK